MTDNRTNEPTAEQIVRGVRKLLNHYSLRGDVPCDEIDKLIDDSEAGLLSEGTPSGAMVEAAAKALHETRNPWIGAYGDWGAAGYEIKQAFRESARAALVAAQGAAPQAESEYIYCPEHGDLLAGNRSYRCANAHTGHEYAAPVLPSSTESPVEPFKTWFACWWKNEPNAIAESNAQSAFYAGWDARGLSG